MLSYIFLIKKSTVINKLLQKIGALTCNISLLLNSFLPYFAAIPAYAVDTAPIAYGSASHQLYFSLDTANYTAYQLFYKTDVKIDSVSGSKLPEYLYLGTCSDGTCLPQSFQSAILKIKTNSGFYFYYFTLNNSQLQIVSEGNSAQLDLTDDEFNLLEGITRTPTSVPTPEITVTPTSVPKVEQICLENNQVITDSTLSDWNRDDSAALSETKEKVRLGVKYNFPQENKVSVTFKCLPKDENLRTTLKIQQIKASELKLPDNTNVSEYAYDITTGMADGTFEYDVTLPKNSDQIAEVSYIEKTLEQAKTNVTAEEIKSIDNLEQQVDTVKATGVDHFTIYIVKTYDDAELNIPKSSYNQGETVFIKGISIGYPTLRIILFDNNGSVIKTCPEGSLWSTTCSYVLPVDASVGTWKVDLERKDISGNWETGDTINFEVVSQNCSTTCPIKTFSTSRLVCPSGYRLYESKCYKLFREPENPTTESFGPVSIVYTKSNDRNKCHRPTAVSLGVDEWARNDFNSQLNEWEDYSLDAPEGYYLLEGVCYSKTGVCVDPNASNYDSELSSIEIADNNTCIYPPAEDCPITCDYPGSSDVIPDGLGGYKTCPSTAACYTPICGNGIIDAIIDDECDDSNTINGDGCSSKCKIEKGWDCAEEPSICVDNGKKITICHASGLSGTRKFNTLELSENAVYSPGNGGHFNEDGSPKAGHESDYLGACTAEDLCGNNVLDRGEECDGTEGVIAGKFCAQKTCKLIPIYDGSDVCPEGTVRSATPVITKEISSTDADGESFDLTPGKKYLFEASGTFIPTEAVGYKSDAGYTLINGSLSTQYGISGSGNDYAAHALLSDFGSGTVGVVNWGTYNPSHTYSKYLSFPDTSSNIQFVIGDRYADWFDTQYQNQAGMNDNSDSLTLNVYECQNPPIKIYAQKVVCDNESYLPNNTQGAITADTAQNWVNNSNSHCRIVDGWDFQFGGIGSYGAFQSNTASLPGWQTMTTVSGVATASINDLSSYGSKIEVREVFPDNSYIPFSNSSSNISAEIYCTGDSANYDNWEWINNPQPGQSYYCVAFNAPNFGSINVTKYNDLNGDGLQGDGEANLSGWTINLSGQTSVVTDINGLATFNKISFGDYTLSETIQPGWTQTNIVCDGDEGIDNDNSHQVSVTAGQTINCKIGNRQLSNVTVYKFNDLNGNGTKDEGENNLSGWTINLTGQTSVSTNEAGQAIFNNLLPGTYDLSENLDSQPGWIQTNIYCDDNNGPGVKITKEGEAYGHHGQCAGWNECKDAATCALWACHVRGYSNLVSYGEGKACTDSSIKNCHLFQYGVNSEPPVLPIASNYEDNGYVDYDWGKGCGVSGVTDIVCSNGSDSGDSSDRGYVSGSQVIVTSGQNKTCYIGNRRLSPEARISKKNNAGLSGLAPGSSVEYKIKLIISGNDVSDFNVTDLLSNGIKYRPGSFSVLKNGASYSIPEPQYHSPGVWKLGDLNAGDVVELSYTADISSDQQPGTYADLVLAYGKAKYEAKSVRAVGEDSDYVNDNFVGTNVIVAKSTQNTVSAGVEKEEVREEGQVLGASTELPSTGSSTLWLIISLLMSLFGLTLIKKSKKLLIVLLFISFCVFPSNAAASSNLSLRVEQPKTPTNLNDVNLNFVALDILARPVTIKCYKKYSSDTTFTQFSTETLIAGGNASHCSLASVLSAEGNYQLKVVAEAEADSVESILSLDYKTSGPGTPGDYRKEHPNNCDYKIHFKTADDSGKTVKVEIYRSDITSFNLDSGSFITAVNLGSNQEHDLTNSVPDCSKNYYYVLRAFDNAGNGSGTTGDSVVKVVSTTSSIATTSTTSSSTSQGAIPVTNVTIAPEAPETITAIPTLGSEEGSVLGTQNQTPSFLQKYWLPLALALIAGIAIIRYVFVKRKASR